MTMILLFNPGEFRNSCQEERTFELSFGREVSQAIKLEGPDIPSRKIGNSQVTKAQGNSTFCKQKEIQDGWTLLEGN